MWGCQIGHLQGQGERNQSEGKVEDVAGVCPSSPITVLFSEIRGCSYSAPFDRHDWIVDRCGTRVRYIIDFYTGQNSNSGPSFYLDVRPALDNWEGVKMRVQHFWQRSLGSVFTTSSSSSSNK